MIRLKLPVNERALIHTRKTAFLRFLAILFVLPGTAALSLGQTANLTTLYGFCSQANCADGAAPWAGLIQASDGNFYGTTQYGGDLNACTLSGTAVGCGTAFRLTPAGVLTTLHSFNGADGSNPYSNLIQGSDGNFYGTAIFGGNLSDCTNNAAPGCGVVFKITPSGKMTTLYEFTGGSDGANPYSGLVQGSDGSLYGTTQANGTFGLCCGTIFKITTSGVLTTIYRFDGSTDGDLPSFPLLEGSDGNFYGTTDNGGTDGYGTAFQLTPAGGYSVIGTFSYGLHPSGLVEYWDDSYYGTTYSGGQYGFGTFFTVAADQLTTLYSFTDDAYGGFPASGVFPASDGNFYGTTTNDDGTIFKLTPFLSKLTTLYTFTDGTDGGYPQASLIQGSDGALYGTTVDYGPGDGGGTVYRLATSPSLAAPVQLSLSDSSISPGSPVVLTWQVLNAFSNTMQLCYAFVQNSPTGAGKWAGKQTGTYSSSTRLFTGSVTITPTVSDTYTYALTCGGRESGFATLTVAASKTSSTTALSASPNPAFVGQSVTLKATVTGSGTTPTGSVNFSAEGVTLGSASLNSSGVASVTANSNGIPPGSYPVIATYAGNVSYSSSASNPVSVTLTKAATTTTLTVSPNPVSSPATATLTASVTRSGSGSAGFATGSVTFSSEGIVLGSAKLDASGVATLKASSAGIPSGAYSVTAAYSGDSSDDKSVSSAALVTVK
jgi:uncharacterized repeat protein (TIGR03803 family)